MRLSTSSRFSRTRKGENKIMLRRFTTALTLLCACGAVDVGFSQTATQAPAQTEAPAKPAPVVKNEYSNGDNWLCRSGRQDACAVDLSIIVIFAKGKLK